MDINNYSKDIQDLINKMLKQKGLVTPDIFETLTTLMKIAEEMEDENLIGYTHYHIADSLYAFEIDYGRFRAHLAKAINYLQMCGDDENLVRAYNYVGIDANNNGLFDVAYYHFKNALDLAESINSPYLQGVVSDNIGQVFARFGDHQKAIEYVHTSNELQLEGACDDTYFYQNMVNGYFSEGVLNILLGNIKEAKRLDNEIRKLEKNEAVADISTVVIPVSFLRLQLAIIEGQEDLVEKYSEASMDMINHAHRIFDYITDIKDLCLFLIKYNRLELVRKILDTITEPIENNNIIEMRRHLANIEVAYYEKLGNEEQVVKYLKVLHDLSKLHEKEQFKIYEFSIDLINSMHDLRKEKELLQNQAETDMLTGIANRAKMEQYIDYAFENAYRHKHNFAIEMLDIDRFKEYNDTYGHHAGDVVLVKVANRLAKLAKEEKVNVARYGGDEFVIIFENKSDEEISKFCNRLKKAIYDLNIYHEKAIQDNRITVSQGICNDIPVGKAKSWEFFVEADKALYEVKKNYFSNNDTSKSYIITHLPK